MPANIRLRARGGEVSDLLERVSIDAPKSETMPHSSQLTALSRSQGARVRGVKWLIGEAQQPLTGRELLCMIDPKLGLQRNC
jgi:hypothetical protein